MGKVHTWQGTPHLILEFQCPGCDGKHSIPVVISDKPEEHAWGWNGSSEVPTIVPSILVNVGGGNPTVPICHLFVREGKIEFLSDCSHKLAGQTVELTEA